MTADPAPPSADEHVEDEGHLGAELSRLREILPDPGHPGRKGLPLPSAIEVLLVVRLHALGQIGARHFVICRPIVHLGSPFRE
jgi:hypothetical protein